MENKKKTVKSTLQPQNAKPISRERQLVKSPMVKVNNKVPLIKVNNKVPSIKINDKVPLIKINDKVPLIKINDKSPSRSLTAKDLKPFPVTPKSEAEKLKLGKSPSNYITPKRLYQKGDAAWPDMPTSLVKKGSWKKRPKPAHSGVPVPEKMKKLQMKLAKGELNFS